MIDRHSLNSEINLGTYKVNFLDQDGRTFSEGEVTASQIFQPKQNFVFRLIRGKFKLRDESISPFELLNIDRCTFIDLDKTVDIAITNIQLGKEFDASFIILKPPLSFDSGNRLKLVNFIREVDYQTVELQLGIFGSISILSADVQTSVNFKHWLPFLADRDIPILVQSFLL